MNRSQDLCYRSLISYHYASVTTNINGGDVQRKNVVNNVDKSSQLNLSIEVKICLC